MKKLIAIFLLSVYMFSATELYELLKINVLLDHYAETKKQRGDISFLDFLVMHYITDDGNKKDDDRDSQLPFKSSNNIIASNSFTFKVEKPMESAQAPLVVAKMDFPDYCNPYFSTAFCSPVWEPPRC